MPQTVNSLRCPKCGGAGKWRTGVGFEHEKRCSKCNVVWEPGTVLESSTSETNKTALDEQVGGEHYKEFSIQPVEYIAKNHISFLAGNVIKYISRYNLKGEGEQDVRKAIHYCNLILELEYGGEKSDR